MSRRRREEEEEHGGCERMRTYGTGRDRMDVLFAAPQAMWQPLGPLRKRLRECLRAAGAAAAAPHRPAVAAALEAAERADFDDEGFD
eukprot:6268212-Pyramimonas_sp.AAC.2